MCYRDRLYSRAHVCPYVHVSHSDNPLFTPQPSIVRRLPICLFVTVTFSFRRDIGMRPIGRRKYRYCLCYCKSRNGITTLSLYCNHSQVQACRRGFGPSALFTGSFAWRTKSECKNSVRYTGPFDRLLCVLVWPVTSQRTSTRSWLLNLEGLSCHCWCGRKWKFIVFLFGKK